jgi:hypothetical protein
MMKEDPSDALPKSMHASHKDNGSRLGNPGDVQMARITGSQIDLSDGKSTEKAVVDRLGQINAMFATLPASPPPPPQMTGRAAAEAAAAAASSNRDLEMISSGSDIYAPAPVPILDDISWTEVQQLKTLRYGPHITTVYASMI